MEFNKTEIPGLYLIDVNHSEDERGSFTKLFNDEIFREQGIDVSFRESYYSVSDKNVIRGMHFQLPPHDHCKLISVLYGSVEDVILDLRKDSPMYGKCLSFLLNAEKKQALFIPKGCAHGFKSLEDGSMMLYYVETGYAKEADTGILYSSIPYDFGIDNPILSKRDLSFIELNDFRSPF